MNRAVNNIIFVVAATVFIFLLIFVIFIILFVPMMIFLPQDNQTLGMLGMGLVFILSLGGSFFIYNKVVKIVMKKFDLEKYIGSGKK